MDLKELMKNGWSYRRYSGGSTGGGSTSIDVTAKVGQTIVVKAVDANGKPTAWESAEYQPRTHWEETITIKGDTLTWDGNTDGRVHCNSGMDIYKISHITPEITDFTNGVAIKYSNIAEPKELSDIGNPDEIFEAVPGVIMLDAGGVLIVSESVAGTEIEGITMPEAGIYFYKYVDGNGQYIEYITIPGYNGFETTTTVVKKIPPKYLPEHLQFGTETKVVEGDTLIWDGNTEGKVIASDAFVKISDVVLTSDDLENGYKFSYVFDGVTDERELTEYERPNNDILVICDGGVICVSTDGVSIDEFVFPEKGTYIAIDYTEASPVSLTIHGYNGFETTTTVVKKIELKYLPDQLQFGEEITTVKGDTLTWDGSIEGKELLDIPDIPEGYAIVKLSDAVITPDVCPDGLSFEYKSGDVVEYPQEILQHMYDEMGGICLADGTCYVIPTDNFDLGGGLVFPKAGIYSMRSPDEEENLYTVASITIPGYEFENTVSKITTIDKKYLPSTMPEVSSKDNGALLQVVDGKWAVAHILNVEESEL